MSVIYVFLYQNLNFKTESANFKPRAFMYFYIRKKYRRKGLKNKNLMLLYNKRINKKLKGLTLVFYIS